MIGKRSLKVLFTQYSHINALINVSTFLPSSVMYTIKLPVLDFVVIIIIITVSTTGDCRSLPVCT